MPGRDRRHPSPSFKPLLASTTVVGNLPTNATIGDVTNEDVLPHTMRFGLIGALMVAVVGAGGTVGSTFLLNAAFEESLKLVSPPPPQPRCAHPRTCTRTHEPRAHDALVGALFCSQPSSGPTVASGTPGTGKRALTIERTSATQFNAPRTNLTVFSLARSRQALVIHRALLRRLGR